MDPNKLVKINSMRIRVPWQGMVVDKDIKGQELEWSRACTEGNYSQTY